LVVRKVVGPDSGWRNEEEGYAVTWSGEYEVIENFWVRTWIEFATFGSDGPDTLIRVEMRDGTPQVVRLEWTSRPGQSEIRQKHLRNIEVEGFATALVAMATVQYDPDSHELRSSADDRMFRIASKFVERQRLPRELRVITDSFLQAVAEVYRRNIGHAPTQAVAKTFGVKARMASTYVDRARKAGFLPETKQGKKKA
jgi:hypothetical protein